MNDALVHIEASDCMAFDNEAADANVLQEFIRSQSENVFFLTNRKRYKIDDSKLAEYDYRQHQWVAGRFVGEAIFAHAGTNYKITIRPRFGEDFLLRMLEEIFNIRITSSASKSDKSRNWQHYLKRIIALIWVQKLANANLHGLPKIHGKRTVRGPIVRGRLNVRKSIVPLHTTNELNSTFHEKEIDQSIAIIVHEAYRILRSEFEIGFINLPDSAVEALHQIFSLKLRPYRVTFRDYQKVRYKEVYKSWKSVVDLSWDIIQQKQMSLKQEKSDNGFGFFLDMAEVWEQYLRSLLRKNLARHDWQLRTDDWRAYRGYFFSRSLIPDLVFQKEDELLVFDAKYKRMRGDRRDVDRADFFQIHTYIQHYLNSYSVSVRVGGLLYPISSAVGDFRKYYSPTLMHEDGAKVKFCIDGVELSEEEKNLDFAQIEAKFVNRIFSTLTG